MQSIQLKNNITALCFIGAAFVISLGEYRSAKNLKNYMSFRHDELSYGFNVQENKIDNDPDESATMLGQQQRSLTVNCGDTLSSILNDVGISLHDIDKINKALSKVYNVKNLQIGQPVYIHWEAMTNASKLTELTTIDTRGNKILLIAKDNDYEVSVCKRVVESRLKFISGNIARSFINSAQKIGVPLSIANEAIRALSPRISQNKYLKDSSFEIIFEERQDVETKKQIGKRKLKYIAIFADGVAYKVFSFGNRYYSDSGESLKTEFFTTPLKIKNIRISSKFGLRVHPVFGVIRKHCGIDYEARYGTDVFASARGVVVAACRNGGYGLFIKIRHSNGFETVYGHLSSMFVKHGDHVEQGDCIGKVGSSGCATGPHLHHEVIRHKIHVDPQKYLCIGPDRLSGTDLDNFKAYKKEIEQHIQQHKTGNIGNDKIVNA
ncbi:MAG: peptidoglycan DD-metalloendopeptidase family protein [Holosporales bacterium]|jgi:murein DD-endopeptidase MepM/ murein hydrolase activator NlpD|nr:peptidoglycan DD-metalloendopeptidase family protein [Holosporales bacterium]